MPSPAVTVIILTKDRPALLQRAVTSVARQEFRNTIQVVVVGDDCSYLRSGMFDEKFPQLQLRLLNVDAEISPGNSTLGRIASLRNLALSQAQTELVAFLDDDNQWTSNHLSSLYETMIATRSPAVHSWRTLVDRENREVIVDAFPWLQDPTRALQRFEILAALGLMARDSAIVHDRSVAIHDNTDYGMVDCGEWLFTRRLMEDFPFNTEFSSTDEFNMIGEDDKLLSDLKQAQIPITCTNTPTLFYTLGGISNRHPKN